MDNITTIILAVFASTGFWTFLNQLITAKKRKKDPQEQMLLALCRDRLLHLSKSYLQRGFIPEDEYNTFKEMGEAYLIVDGDDIVAKKYKEAMELHTDKKETM